LIFFIHYIFIATTFTTNKRIITFNSNKSTNSSEQGTGDEKEASRNQQLQMTFLNSVAADFYRLLNLDQDLANKTIDVQITSDGLRITLFNRAKKPLFVGETADFTEWGRFVMQNLAWNIDRHQFRVTIDGHTRRRPADAVPATADYGDWELSADRANTARRSLVHYAVEPGLIERVTGYADTKPIAGEPPESDSNHRVALSLTFNAKSRLKDKVMIDKKVPILAEPADPVSPPKP
jgi:chemotaxis protein MotB